MTRYFYQVITFLSLVTMINSLVIAGDPACTSTVMSGPSQMVRVSEGSYNLTLVATKGRGKGHQAIGSLVLIKTSSSDRSSRTGEKAYGDVKKYPLYGATNVDFNIVWAAVATNPNDMEPLPTSLDPVFPGVLVIREADRDILVISTLRNRRTDENWMDGSGIELTTLQKTDSEIRGAWDNYGIVVGGSGYFCITPVEETRKGIN